MPLQGAPRRRRCQPSGHVFRTGGQSASRQQRGSRAKPDPGRAGARSSACGLQGQIHRLEISRLTGAGCPASKGRGWVSLAGHRQARSGSHRITGSLNMACRADMTRLTQAGIRQVAPGHQPPRGRGGSRATLCHCGRRLRLPTSTGSSRRGLAPLSPTPLREISSWCRILPHPGSDRSQTIRHGHPPEHTTFSAAPAL